MKKQYARPEISVVEFDVEDIIQTSGAAMPTTIINGMTATGLDATNYTDIMK